MHHCVRIYADQVAEGRYYILTVRDTTGNVCTLGLAKAAGIWTLDQCYGKCNEKPFISETLQKDIVKEINKNELLNELMPIASV